MSKVNKKAETEQCTIPSVGSSATPEIVEKLVDFFQFWQNPDRLESDSFPIKEFQLQIYSPSIDFIFKWRVKKEDVIAAAKFIDVKLKKNQRILPMSLGEYNIELEY